MKAEVYKAAVNGDVSILEDASEERVNELQSVTLKKNNIIHIAVKHGHEKFILAVIKRLAKANDLVEQRNNNGDTPLHVAARHGQQAAAKLLATNGPASLGIVQNEDGDTPLHVALKCSHLQSAGGLARNLQAFSVLNNTKETPFHLLIKNLPSAIQQPTSGDQDFMLNSQDEFSLTIALQAKFGESCARNLLPPFKDAACMCDAEGLTPLLRAARNGLLSILNVILEICPESVEFYDPQGRTVLHYVRSLDYKQLQVLLKVPEIDAQKNVKDYQGNSPAHLAAETNNLTLLTALYESGADFSLENKEDISVWQLIELNGGFSSKMEKLKFNISMGKWMEEELYLASKVSGNIAIFEKKDTTTTDIYGKEIEYNDEYFMSRTPPNGSTILHLAIQGRHFDFVKKSLKHFPTLVMLKDFNGDNALHEAARIRGPGVEVMMRACVECMRTFEGTKQPDGVVYYSPWKARNSKGNNALHEAMRSSNYNIIEELFNIDPSLCVVKNNTGETPLHLLAMYATYTVEDTLDILIKILESNAICAYQRDADGLIPAMRAAKSGRIRLAGLISNYCRQSIEVRDSKGRTFLHLLNIVHLELVDAAEHTVRAGQEIFTIEGVDNLRTAQDEDGNTPLHLAITAKNFVTAKVLLLRCLDTKTWKELSITNNEGHSIFSLLSMLQANKSDDKELTELAIICEKVKEETCIERVMEAELYEAAIEGDVKIFSEYKMNEVGGNKERSYFLGEMIDGSSIVHIALKMGKLNTVEAFVEEALKLFPSLICQQDFNGDNPLHLAAKRFSPANVNIFSVAEQSFQAFEASSQVYILPPWRMKNSRGNMPIHDALSCYNLYAADNLLDYAGAASCVNDAGETPLHVLARCAYNTADSNMEVLIRVIKKNPSAALSRDNEGLTPLLRAAKSGKLHVVLTVVESCPISAQLRDPNGRNFLHLLRLDIDFGEDAFDFILEMWNQKLFKLPEVNALRFEQDGDGNVPLQYAMITGNLLTAKVLANICVHDELMLINNDNKRILDLNRSNEAPVEIVRLLQKKFPTTNTYKSSYGIRKGEIKDSVSSLSVIAALLATMTFAAALQVPGGFDGENGSPVLLKRSAFQVFLVADITAMCGSMLVLFSLLWVLGAGKSADSVVLVDFAFFLLQGSFYATLVAFMTGVYASTTIENTSWVAIFVCALCSIVILLSWKSSILFLTKFIRFLKQSLTNLKVLSFKQVYGTCVLALTRDDKTSDPVQ